jgi:hypothetical protein
LSVAAPRPAKQVLVDDDDEVVVVAVVERVPEIRANKCQLSRSMFPLVRLAETGGLGMKGFTLIRLNSRRRWSRKAPSATFLVGRTPAESSSVDDDGPEKLLPLHSLWRELQQNRRHRRHISIRRRLGRV